MYAAIRIPALASLALGALCLSACATGQLSQHAAALPVYAADQADPPHVTRVLGPVKTYVCVTSDNASSVGTAALNNLRASADAKGATGLVDYRYAFKTNPARVQQYCRQYLEARATAVVFGQAG
jgi:hypothetical protein